MSRDGEYPRLSDKKKTLSDQILSRETLLKTDRASLTKAIRPNARGLGKHVFVGCKEDYDSLSGGLGHCSLVLG